MGVALRLRLVGLLAALFAVHGQPDVCEMADGSSGLCKTIKDCPQAGELILSGGQPKICSFKDRAPIICCGTFPSPTPHVTSRPIPKPIDDGTQARPSSKRPTYKTTYYFLTIFKTSLETSPMTSSTTPVSLVITTPSTTTVKSLSS